MKTLVEPSVLYDYIISQDLIEGSINGCVTDNEKKREFLRKVDNAIDESMIFTRKIINLFMLAIGEGKTEFAIFLLIANKFKIDRVIVTDINFSAENKSQEEHLNTYKSFCATQTENLLSLETLHQRVKDIFDKKNYKILGDHAEILKYPVNEGKDLYVKVHFQMSTIVKGDTIFERRMHREQRKEIEEKLDLRMFSSAGIEIYCNDTVAAVVKHFSPYSGGFNFENGVICLLVLVAAIIIWYIWTLSADGNLYPQNQSFEGMRFAG